MWGFVLKSLTVDETWFKYMSMRVGGDTALCSTALVIVYTIILPLMSLKLFKHLFFLVI